MEDANCLTLPYVTFGTYINECIENTAGSFYCSCLEGYTGDGRKDGDEAAAIQIQDDNLDR